MNILEHNPFVQDPKIVIFDLCGTLMNSKKIDHEAIDYTLSCYNKDCWKITRLKKDKSKSMKDNFSNFFGNYAEEAYAIYINYLLEHVQDISFFDNASEHLKLLKSYNIKTAIITNRDKQFIDALDSHKNFISDIKPFVDIIITADETGITKPSSKIVDYTLKCLSLSEVRQQEDIVFIGDSYADMQVAINYPAVPILLTATTADITEDFLIRNNTKIYQAESHDNIMNMFKQYKRHNKILHLLQSISKRKTEENKVKVQNQALISSKGIQKNFSVSDIIQSIYQSKIHD